jgi:hypothetical protein
LARRLTWWDDLNATANKVKALPQTGPVITGGSSREAGQGAVRFNPFNVGMTIPLEFQCPRYG